MHDHTACACATLLPLGTSVQTLSLGVVPTQAAAHLAKADLATSTVMEMTALAGTMGRHFAHKQVGTGRGG